MNRDWPPFETYPIGDLATKDASVVSILPLTGTSNDRDADWSDRDLRLFAAFIADGFVHRGKLEFQVSNERKIEALTALGPVRRYDAKKVYGPRSTRPLSIFTFELPAWFDQAQSAYKIVNPAFAWALSRRQARLFIDTVLDFDGCTNGIKKGPASQRLIGQASKERIDAFHVIAVLAGYDSQTCPPRVSGEFNSTTYCLGYSRQPRPTRITHAQVKTMEGDTSLYCVTVPSGFIVIRPTFGKAIMVGNCALFVSWCVRQQALSPISAPIAAVTRWKAWFEARGRYVQDRSTRDPGPGDAFVLLATGADGVDTGHGHMGLVLSVDRDAATLRTIEGNTSNGVRQKTRAIASLHGWGAVTP